MTRYVIQKAEFHVPIDWPVHSKHWPYVQIKAVKTPFVHTFLLLTAIEEQNEEIIETFISSLHGLATERGADGNAEQILAVDSKMYRPMKQLSINEEGEITFQLPRWMIGQMKQYNYTYTNDKITRKANGEFIIPSDMPENMKILFTDKVGHVLQIGVWNDCIQTYCIPFPEPFNQFGIYWLPPEESTTVYGEKPTENNAKELFEALARPEVLEFINAKQLTYSFLGIGGGGGIFPGFDWLPLYATVNSNSIFYTFCCLLKLSLEQAESSNLHIKEKITSLIYRPFDLFFHLGIRNLVLTDKEITYLQTTYLPMLLPTEQAEVNNNRLSM